MYWYITIALIVLSIVGVVIFIYSLLHKRVEQSKLKEDREIISYALNKLSLFYCLLVGLVVVDVQSQHNDVQENIVKEASILLDIHQISKSFSFFDQKAISKALEEYVETLYDKELEVLKQGHQICLLPYIHPNKLWKTVASSSPKDAKDLVVYQNMIERLDDLIEARFARFSGIDGRTTPFLWLVLLYGGLLILACSLMFSSKSKMSHALHLSFNVSLIALILLLIYSLDSPFMGPTEVSFRSFHEVLEAVQNSS